MVTIGVALLLFLTFPGELTSSLSITVENKADTATNTTTEEKEIEKAANFYLKQKPPGNSYLEGPAVEPNNKTTSQNVHQADLPIETKETNFSLKQPPSGKAYLEGPHVKLEGLESLKKESSVAKVPPEDKTNNFYLKQKPSGNSYLEGPVTQEKQKPV